MLCFRKENKLHCGFFYRSEFSRGGKLTMEKRGRKNAPHTDLPVALMKLFSREFNFFVLKKVIYYINLDTTLYYLRAESNLFFIWLKTKRLTIVTNFRISWILYMYVHVYSKLF